MMNPRNASFFMLVLAIALDTATGAGAQSAGVTEIDRIVAVVNEGVITNRELQGQVRTTAREIRRSGTRPPPDHVLAKQVLERMILEQLQLQAAKRSGLQVSDEAVDRQIATLAEENRLSLKDFRRAVERDGYDFAAFRERIRNQILIFQVRQQQMQSRVQVSRRDIDNYLATQAQQGEAASEYRLSHILVAVPDGASPEEREAARKEALEVLDKLKDGGDFQNLALTHSDGQQALEGGDLGWRTGADLPTLFADKVPGLAVGELAGPIPSPGGYHLLKLNDLRSAHRFMVTQTRARHLLIKPDELTDEARARDQLLRVRERVELGDDFANLALSLSDDPGSATKGGELGWLNPGDVVPEFQTRMDSLDEGGISEPFETRFGWHIVQVLERREQDSSEQIKRNQAREQIRSRKTEEELQTWLRRLRDEAYVEYRPDA